MTVFTFLVEYSISAIKIEMYLFAGSILKAKTLQKIYVDFFS
jgi:hypothetical protein